MNRKPVPSSKAAKTKDRKSLVFLLSFLILACLSAAAFFFFSGLENPESPVGYFQAADHPDLFYLPGDFEPQECIFLAGGRLADQAPDILVKMLRSLDGAIKIRMLTGSSADGSKVTSFLAARGLGRMEMEFLNTPLESPAIRDFGPFTVSDSLGRRSMVDFHFQNQGGSSLDNGFPAVLAVNLGMNVMGSRLILEGGDLLSNGLGFGLVSTRVIDRNAGNQEMDSQAIIQNIASLLGFESLILVPQLEGESSGHVDMFCAFLEPGLVVVGSYEPAVDRANAENLDRTAKTLEDLTTPAGRLRVERLPMPDHDDGVWRSYTTIVFANEVVLVPTYPDYCPDLDEKALAIYQRLLPTRRIVGIDASHMISTGGGLRGITLNIPTGHR